MRRNEIPETWLDKSSSGGPGRRGRFWTRIGISAFIALLVLAIVVGVVIHRAGPILKGRVEETLSTRFDSRVKLGNLNVSVLNGLEVSGDRLLIYPPDSVVAAGATQPLIAIDHFRFHSGMLGLFIEPMRVEAVQITGLQIDIPSRNLRSQGLDTFGKHRGKIKMLVAEIICDNSRLLIGTSNPDKDPKDFELKHIVLRDVGPNASWRYDAVLTNAIPRGEIRSTGTFGPWRTETPGESSVEGHYTFEHADLNTIKGLGGMLSSVGNFKGQLDKIVVDGITETPNFSLDTANRPLQLHTQFHAIVDGTTGDTYLQPVKATLRNSTFTASGAVINIKGYGHRIDLDLDVPSAELQDFLDLAVRADHPVMTGLIRTRTKLQIRPGKESVTQKLSFAGQFTLQSIHTNPKVQDKVDMLSLRAQGEPKQAHPGAKDVNSRMTGTFKMANRTIDFSNLSYVLPGGQVNLVGSYSLDGQHFDFHGKVLTDASLSHLVASRWASLLLKAVSPFLFKRKGGGAEIPVSINGTKSAPKFGLELFGHH